MTRYDFSCLKSIAYVNYKLKASKALLLNNPQIYLGVKKWNELNSVRVSQLLQIGKLLRVKRI